MPRKTIADCWTYAEIVNGKVDNLKERFEESQKDMKCEFKDMKENVNGAFDKFDIRITELFNHQSSHLPKEYVDQLAAEKDKSSKESSIKWAIITGLGVAVTSGILFMILN